MIAGAAGLFCFGVLFVALLLTGQLGWSGSERKENEAVNSAYTDAHATGDIKKDLSKPLGSEENPFVVLEIVAYRGYGELGYWAGGSEPIDLQYFLDNYKDWIGKLSFLNNHLELVKDYWKIYYEGVDGKVFKETLAFCNEFEKMFGEEKYRAVFEHDASTLNKELKLWSDSGAKQIKENGYYTKVEENTGLYTMSLEGESVIFSFVGEGKGEYIWTKDSNQPENVQNIEEISIGDKIWMNNQTITRGYVYKSGYSNREMMKRAILQTDDEEIINKFHLKVITVTPEEINSSVENDTEKTLDYTEIADLVYISSMQHDPTYSWLYENFSQYGKAEPVKYTDQLPGQALSNGTVFPSFYETYSQKNVKKNNDLSWSTVEKIFKRVALDERLPIIFDSSVYLDTVNEKNVTIAGPKKAHWINEKSSGDTFDYILRKGYYNNVAKLHIMCNFMDPGMFYTLYMEPDVTTGEAIIIPTQFTTPEGYKVTTGKFNVSLKKGETTDTQIYWNDVTFIKPYVVFLDGTKIEGYSSHTAYWAALGMYGAEYIMERSARGNVFVFASEDILDKKLYNQWSTGFEEVINYYGTASVDVPQIVNYIVKYYQRNTTIYKKELNILDLEPCTIQSDADYTKLGITKDTSRIITAGDFRKILSGQYAGDINIVRQSSAEFNGKIESLSENYDLIYLGLNFSMMNKSGGKTVYNDTSLNGKIYLHVGDMIPSSETKGGGEFSTFYSADWLGDTPSNRYMMRTSGNDITERKREQLESYLKAGYPILATSEFYSPVASNTVSKPLIDASSNIYKLTSQITNYNQIFMKTNDSDLKMKLKKGLSIQKPNLDLQSNTPIRYLGVDSNGVVPDSNYLKGRLLEFKFTIGTKGKSTGKQYTAKIYVDTNADGRFDEKTELIFIRENFYLDGIEQSIQRALSTDYVGVIPWKLEIIDAENSDITMSETGYSAIKRTKEQKELIRILQINQSNHYYNTDSGNRNATRSGSSSSNLNLQNEYANSTSLFHKYLKNLNDYSVEIKTVSMEDFEKGKVVAGIGNDYFFDKNGSAAAKTEDDVLYKNYDMLIFGFADYMDTISNAKGVVDNTMYFIEKGKSVLFTHDVTSYNNVASQGGVGGGNQCSGYSFNLYYRDVLSMDRFGARSNLTGAIPRDTATKPDGGTHSSIHGYTNWAIKNIRNGVTKAPSGNNTNCSNPIYATNSSGISELSGRANNETTKVSKLNDGQITQYPYYIPDSINVATTHSQYFQLDLEDEEVVVWYCLAKDTANKSMWYQCAYNDASNNYYIYNKGNITYSGVGHSKVNSEYEVKLFVNTMVGAYKNALELPTVEIQDTLAVKLSKSEYNVYVNNDYQLGATEDFGAEDYEYILFSPKDNNFTRPELYVTIGLFDNESKKKSITDQIEVYKVNQNPETNSSATALSYTTTVNGLEYILMNGETYVLKYPKMDLNETKNGKALFNVVNKVNDKELSGDTVANVRIRGLFPLD